MLQEFVGTICAINNNKLHTGILYGYFFTKNGAMRSFEDSVFKGYPRIDGWHSHIVSVKSLEELQEKYIKEGLLNN